MALSGDAKTRSRRRHQTEIPSRDGPRPIRRILVTDYEAAKPWYERLLGGEPSFIAHATEGVWELAEHRYLFIEEDTERAGRAIHTVFVDDLDVRVADIASRGIGPDERVTYPGKARKAIYRDADGNEISFGGPVDSVGS